MPRRLQAPAAIVLSLVAAVGLTSCTTPGAQNLDMPALPDCLSSGSMEGAATSDSVETEVQQVLRENEFCGQDATVAFELLKETGVPVCFILNDGTTAVEAPQPGARVVDVALIAQESEPPTHIVILTLHDAP